MGGAIRGSSGSAVRADAGAIANDQYPDHKFGVGRRSAHLAVIRGEATLQLGKISEAVDGTQQVFGQHMGVEGEVA